MNCYLFRATRLGWDKVSDGIYFDTADCTLEEAKNRFTRITKTAAKGIGMVEYTAYEYGGVTYHHVDYLGIYPKNALPCNDREYLESKYTDPNMFERLR